MKIMKILILSSFFIVMILIFGIPKYVELNDLAIIQGVGVSCLEKDYSVYLKEIIPIKGDAGITYQYKYYQGNGKTIKQAYEKLHDKTKKKLYLSKVKFLVTNCSNTKDLTYNLDRQKIDVYHTNDSILDKLKKINS